MKKRVPEIRDPLGETDEHPVRVKDQLRRDKSRKEWVRGQARNAIKA